MNLEGYEKMWADAHRCYSRGFISQRRCLTIMDYKPTTSWTLTKLHTIAAWCVKVISES